MSITRFPPNTIALSGPSRIVNDVVAGEVLTPGMLAELYNSSGAKYRKHAATGALAVGHSFVLNRSMLNESVTTTVANDATVPIGELPEIGIFAPGDNVWALIASGANITVGGYLQSAGNGFLEAFSTGAKIAQALETQANVTVSTRIRVEVV